MENFNYPFISKSGTEFWRRWHISLGSWFRDYVYIPMGGNRVRPARHLLNIFTIWFLTGFWHGADWNFILWGLYFGIVLIVEKHFLLKYLNRSRILSHVYLLFTVGISFMIFRFTSLSEMGEQIASMLGFGKIPLVSAEFWYQLRNFGVVLLLAIVGATPLPKLLFTRFSDKPLVKKTLVVLEPAVLIALLTVVTAYLVDGSFNPFLYFRY